MARMVSEQGSWAGYGSTFSKVQTQGSGEGIDLVLGNQIWRVRPDEEEKMKNPCLWMQAGVVKRKSCTNFYDCTSCKYDQVMRAKVEQGKQISWQDAMRFLSDKDRVCRHTLTQRIGHRVCAYDYHCETCDFDQYFEDVLAPRQGSGLQEVFEVKGFDLPVGFYFHNGHTWARIESGGYIRIGMDDFALKVLGEMDGYDLPLMGKVMEQEVPSWGINRQGHWADVLSPAGGVIVESNQQIRENPRLANKNPYEDGWLFLLRTDDLKASMKKLMDDRSSLPWLKEEVKTLEQMVEDVAGPLSADGGIFAPDVYGNLPQLGWDRLTKTFLKAPTR